MDEIAYMYTIPFKRFSNSLKADIAAIERNLCTVKSTAVVRIQSEDSSQSATISPNAGNIIALAVQSRKRLFSSAVRR
jgi:hypothetical protein